MFRSSERVDDPVGLRLVVEVAKVVLEGGQTELVGGVVVEEGGLLG